LIKIALIIGYILESLAEKSKFYIAIAGLGFIVHITNFVETGLKPVSTRIQN
jgi:hypothetical protein